VSAPFSTHVARQPTPAGVSVDLSRFAHATLFWTTYIRLGFGILAGESAGVIVYLFVSPSGPHRRILESIASLALVLAAAAVPLAGYFARQNWRSSFSEAACLLSGAVVTLCIVLDGGLGSPLIFLLALPLLNATLALPIRQVAICAIATVLEFVIVAVTDPNVAHSVGDLTALSAFVAGVLVLAMGWTINRSRLEQQQTALLNEVVCLATTDSLTGCLSHGALFERLDVEIGRALRNEEPLSFLMMDVDLFKAFNDSYGHAAGDEALAGVGSVLRATSRTFDVAGRVGGDEFVVILPATELAAARLRAERLIEALRQWNDMGITVSIGVATLDRHEPTKNRLFRDADSAMYQAKADGRTRVVSPRSGFRYGYAELGDVLLK
jgi:diguanylate cyclase (GGDEF)-like protein